MRAPVESPISMRSCLSVERETFQPSPRLPTMFRAGMRTSSKNTSQKSTPPCIMRERPHVDARRLHRDQQVGDAGVLRRVGLGAEQAEHHVGLGRRWLVQIFWPLITHSSPTSSARDWSEARSLPAPGSL